MSDLCQLRSNWCRYMKQPLKGQGKVAEPGRTGGWSLLAHSGKCLSVNPKYSMWISVTMMMQAVDTYKCVCDRRRGGFVWNVLQFRFGTSECRSEPFGLGLPHFSHSALDHSLLLLKHACLKHLCANPMSDIWLPGQRRACLLVTLTYCPLLAMETIPRLGKWTVVAAQPALWGSCRPMWTSQAHLPYELLCLVTHAQDEETGR